MSEQNAKTEETAAKTLEPKSLGVLTPEAHLSTIRHSPCGSILAGAGFDQAIHRWDLRGGEFPPPAMPKIGGHNGFVTAIGFHPDRFLGFSADSWGQLRAWPYLAENPQPYWAIPEAHDGWVRDLDVSANGEWIVTCGRDETVRIFSTTDGRQAAEFTGHAEDVFCVAAHPDNRRAVSADLKGRVFEWEIATGRKLREFDATEFHLLHRLQDIAGVRKLSFEHGGKTLLVAGGIPSGGANVRGRPHVKMFDFASGEVLHQVVLGDENKDVFAHDVALHPDGYLIAVTTGQPGQGNVILHRPGDEEPIFKSNKGTVNCHGLSLAPDAASFVVSATNSGSNGNGRRLKDGKYLGNHSPLHVFSLEAG